MAQHIGCILEKTNGKFLKDSGLDFVRLHGAVMNLHEKATACPLLRTIDPYDDTTFECASVPSLIRELDTLRSEVMESELHEDIFSFIEFLSRVGNDERIVFVGD